MENKECKICEKGWLSFYTKKNEDEKHMLISFKESILKRSYRFSIPCKCEKGESILSEIDVKLNLNFRNIAYENARKLYLETCEQYRKGKIKIKMIGKLIHNGRLRAWQYLYSEDNGKTWVWDSPFNPDNISTITLTKTE